jgi:chromosome segregation ATPase
MIYMFCVCILSCWSFFLITLFDVRIKKFPDFAETDDKVEEILKLIKEEVREERDGTPVEKSKKEPLAKLVKDLHKQYQSLYARYDHLTGELRKKAHGKQGNDSASSSSDSDSEHSSKERVSKNGQLESERQKISDGIKQELETAHLEVADLKRNLTTTSEEKEALNLEYVAALSKIQEADKAIADMKTEVERLNNEKSELMVEKSELNKKLETAGNIEAELTGEKETAIRRIEEGEKITEGLRTMVDQLKDEKINLVKELEAVTREVSNMKQQVSDLSQNLKDSKDENKSLTFQISGVSNDIQQAQKTIQELMADSSRLKEKLVEREGELSNLKDTHEVHDNESSAQINGLDAQVRKLEQELELLRTQKIDTEVQIEIREKEFCLKQQQLLFAEERVSDLSHTLKATEEENKSLTLKVSEISNEVQQAHNVIQELKAESSQLKENIIEREREISTLAERHGVNENELSARMKELSLQVAGLEVELDLVQNGKRDMDAQIERKATEAKQLREENIGMQARISDFTARINNLLAELDSLHTKKGEMEEEIVRRSIELSAVAVRQGVHENGLSAQMTELEGQVAHLEVLLKNVEGLKRDMGVQIESKATEAKQLREENIEMQARISELQNILKEREEANSVLMKKLDDNERESSSRVADLTARINNLLADLDSVRNQKSEFEEQIGDKVLENGQLKEAKAGLQDKIIELEKTLTDRGFEFSAIDEKFKSAESEASAQIMALEAKINSLQQELDSLQTQKNELELQFEREKQELSESLTQMENQKVELTSKITDHQRILKEQEDANMQLNEEYKQLEGQLQECKLSLKVAERKIEETAEEFRNNIESKAQVVADLEELAEVLRRDLEVKADEHSTQIENVRTIEFQLRLSNQKLRVTEQELSEKEEDFRIKELGFQQERRALEDRIATLSGIIASNNEAHQRMITDISENVNRTLTELAELIQKFQENCRNYENSMSGMSAELHLAKNWVTETNKDKEELSKEVKHLAEQLQDKIDQEIALREQIEKLVVKASKEEDEIILLRRAVEQLEKTVGELEKMMKEKEEGILGIGEEKREAIRQLCVWIDYHRSCNDYLKETLSKVTGRGQRAS